MKDLDAISEKVIASLKNKGADMAYCSVSRKETKEFNVDGGEFSLLRTLFDDSLSMTAFKDGKKGAVGINSFEDESIDRAVNDCLAAAESSQSDDGWGLCPDKREEHFTEGTMSPEYDRLFERTKELLEAVKSDYPLIVMEQMIVSFEKAHSVYRNTNEAHFTKDSGLYSVSLMFSAHDGEKASSFFSSGFITDSLEAPFIECGTVRRDLADVQRQIDTKVTEGKFSGTMVLSPDCFADLIGSIADNFAGDGAILEGTSIWKDSLGETVADPRLTVSFAPHADGIIAAQSFSAEGFVSEDFDFIKDGKLSSFLLSLYVANKKGLERAKNSGTGLCIKAGDISLDELIGSVEKGILVGRFSGGAPAAGGDFSGVAKNSFLIENGKVTDALSETMISGNLAEMLKNLRGISKERVCDGTSLLPWAAFDGITVSGK